MNIGRVAKAVLVLGAVALSGCGGSDTPPDLLSQLQGIDAREALALANEWRTTEPNVLTTLTSDAVNFSLPTGEQVSIPLPAGVMVVAVAPYVVSTHDCQIHSISGCQGEMAGIPMWVHAETPDGTVLIDEMMTPMDDGFLELWLPRDREIDLTIGANGMTATGRITTNATSNTCVPELQLQ